MDALLCQKTISTVSRYSIPFLLPPFTFNVIVLEQFLILLLSLFLSYQFSNYTIYATIVIAYIYHIFGHLIQTIVLRKYVPGLLTGSLTSLFSIAFLKIEISVKLYGYSF